MISTAWYFDDAGNLVEFKGSTMEHEHLRRSRPWASHDGLWHGPFSSEHAAVTVWEFR